MRYIPGQRDLILLRTVLPIIVVFKRLMDTIMVNVMVTCQIEEVNSFNCGNVTLGVDAHDMKRVNI